MLTNNNQKGDYLMQEVTCSKKTIWIMGTYSLLTLSIMVGFMYINTFGTEILLIPATTLATALLVAKILDFIVSVFAGIIIEKFKLSKKLGKNQAWLKIGRWVLAVMIMLEVCNTSAAPMAMRVAVLAVSYTILNCLMNMLQTAYYNLVGVVAGPNPANRNAMTVNMTRQCTVVTLVCSFIPTLVTYLPFGNWNYFIVAFVFMIPMLFAMNAISKQADGLDQPAGKNQPGAQVTMMDMINTLIRNPKLLALFICQTIFYIGQYVYQSNYTYYFIYVVGDFTKLTVCSLVGAVIGIFASMIMPKLVGSKLGKKGACVFGFAVYGVGMILCTFLAVYSWILYIVCMAVVFIGTYTYMPYYMTMYLDCGEWYLWKTGKDTRGVAMGLGGPPLKIGMAIGGSLGLYLLGATGYEAGMTATASWTSAYMAVSFLVPGIITVAAALLLLITYRLKDADVARYSQENADKMAAAMAAAAEAETAKTE